MRIAFLGSTGFPIGLAEVNKQILISKALILEGNRVTVICNKPSHHDSEKFPPVGTYEKINYLYTSIITYKDKNKFKRKLYKIIGYIIEIFHLFKTKYDVYLLNTRNFSDIIKYIIISKVKKIKTYLIIVEDPDQMNNAKTILGKINSFLFYNIAWKYVNGGMPISEFLINKVKRYNPNLPILKVPTMVDLDLFVNFKSEEAKEKYFLFCGSADYTEIILFIINAFEKLTDNEYHLYIVTNGSKRSLKVLENKISNSHKKHLIKKFGYLPYLNLVSLYKNAKALLIPLRNNKRDISRFPHKIGEYLASGNPIISTNIGEIKFYLKNYKTALLAEDFSEKEFANMMNYVIQNPKKAKLIGKNGFEICKNNFDYKTFGEKIIKFINLT